MPAIISLALAEELPPPNVDDIIALDENLNHTVVMNRLRTCQGYAVLKKYSLQVEDGDVM
jgi:hypothetical protein